MSVGIGIIGREITATVGGQTLVGVQTKGVTFNNEPLDVTDDGDSGWQELLAKPGRKSIEYAISGVTKNLELINTYFQTSNTMAVAITYPDGSTLAFDGFLSALSHTGAENELDTFDATLMSSGAPTFTAGT